MKHGQRFLNTGRIMTRINRAREVMILRCAQYVGMNVVLLGKDKRHNSLRKSGLKRDSKVEFRVLEFRFL
jgi:hypothetical protein